MHFDPQHFIRARDQESLTEWASRLSEKAQSDDAKGTFEPAEVRASRFASERQIVLLWLRNAINNLAETVTADPSRHNAERLRWAMDFYLFLQEHSVEEAVEMAGEPIYHNHLNTDDVQFPTEPSPEGVGEKQDGSDPLVEYNDLFGAPALQDGGDELPFDDENN